METVKYFGGIPTALEVKKLKETYPENRMKHGDIIDYDDVSEIINARPKTSRFKVITWRWRSLIEKDTGIRIGAFEGTHFKVLNESEKLEFIQNKKRSVTRQMRKNLIRTSYVDRSKLTQKEKDALDHEAMNAKNMLASQQLRTYTELPAM